MQKITYPLAAITLLALSWPVLAQTTAPITAVTLYPGSATIVRTARVEAGATRLVVGELSTRFGVQTLRVEGDAGIRIGQIVTQDAARTESANSAEAALETRIQALRDEAAMLDVQAGAADIVTSFLERAGGPAAPADRGPAPIDARSLAAVVGVINQSATEALSRKQQVAVQKREITKKIEALTRDLARVRSDSRDSRTVTIQLVADRAGQVRIAYQLNNAGWKPAYRAELNSTTSAVALERLAQVSQKTGEDWKGVRLALSTTQPRLSPQAVTPEPWLLQYFAPRPQQEAAYAVAPRAAPAPAPAAMAMARAGGEQDRGEAPYTPPTFQTDGAFATEFVVPSPVTLPADGREVSLPLAQQTLNATQRIQVAPRLSTTPVITAEVARPAGVWPAGNVQLYRDGSYVGAASWDPQSNEKWKLSFGRDDLLLVQFNPVKGDSGSTGIFDKRNQRRIANQITLRNNHAAAIEVLVIEAAPVSTSDEVKVQVSFEPKPTFDTWEQRRGVVAWLRSIPPQQAASITVNYTIEYPKEGAVAGLP